MSPLELSAALVLVALGPIAGSAAHAFASRYPHDLTGWLFGRSRCPHCKAQLSARDLVPLVSFVLARGRCRFCGAPIDPESLGAELFALAIATVAVIALPFSSAVLVALVGWVLLAAALVDRRTLLLPDVLTLPLLLAGIAAAWFGLAPARPLEALSGAALGFAFLALVAQLYRALRGREGLGLGDAKLMAAAGAWLGPLALPRVLFIGALCALAVALASGAWRRPEQPLPFGPWLALAFLCVLVIEMAARANAMP